MKQGRYIVNVLIIAFLVMVLGLQKASAQDKHRVRVKADYIKIMDGRSLLEIKTTARINKQNVDLPGLELTVVNEIEGEEIVLGNLVTDHKGEGQFSMDLGTLKADSLLSYTLGVNFKGTDTLRRASRSVQFKDADLIARLIVVDSVHHISAELKEAVTDSLLSEQNITVQVERLFAPLVLSEEINLTDESGTVLVPIPEGIPGVDGKLTLETVLKDSDDYGTVKAILDAPIGVPIVDESDFDERTLWSPRNKTPLFILLFTGILILGTWGTILYLVRILYKIAKH